MGIRLAVALDLAEADDPDHLLRRATHYARAAGGVLDIVHVTDDPARDRPTVEALLTGIPEPLRGEARLLPGDIVDVLVAVSTELDLMIVGPREPQGLDGWLRGPTAVRVLRRAQCAVVIPKTDRFGDRPPRLLMGVDLSGETVRETVAMAGDLAARLGGTLDLLYTLPGTLPPVRRPDLRDAVFAAWETGHAEDKARVAALLATLPEAVQGEALIDPAEPEDAIVHRAGRYDLVVVGNRNRKGLGGLVLGPVAASVAQRAACDVLVLPTATLA